MNAKIRKTPGFLIRRLHQLSVAVFMKETAAFDITPVQYSVLAVVADAAGIDQVSAAQTVGIDRTTIVGVVTRLERKGLLERRASLIDKRARELFATDEGCALLQGVDEAVARTNARLTGPFSSSEAGFFCEQLERLISFHESEDIAHDGDTMDIE